MNRQQQVAALEELASNRTTISRRGVTVRFEFREMGAIEGFEVFDRLVRPYVTDLAALLKSTNSKTQDEEVIQSILNIFPSEVVIELRRILFDYIDYTRASDWRGLTELGRDADKALQGLNFSAVYELLVRAVLVNFLDSTQSALQRLEELGREDDATNSEPVATSSTG